MNEHELRSKARELSDKSSGYNLARRLLVLEEELQEARKESQDICDNYRILCSRASAQSERIRRLEDGLRIMLLTPWDRPAGSVKACEDLLEEDTHD